MRYEISCLSSGIWVLNHIFKAHACWNLDQIHVCQCDARIACTVLPLVTPITLDCLLSWSNYLITTYTTFTFHNKLIMLSCQNQVLYITSIRASPSYCYQSLNFSKFFCWLCTSVFLNTLACVFFTLLPIIKHIKDHRKL